MMKTQVLLALLFSVAFSGTIIANSSPSNYITGTFPPYPGNAPAIPPPSTQQVNANQFGIIANAQKSLNVPVKSFASLFSRLPSPAELEQIILSADSVAVLKTLQTLISDDSIPCNLAFEYALDVLGKIRCAIEIKDFAVSQLQVVIDAATAEIARLQKENDSLNAAKNALGLEALKAQLANLSGQLNKIYQQYNQVNSQIPPNEAKIAGYQQDILNNRQASQAKRNIINSDNIELVSVDRKISELEQQLAAARQRRAFLQAEITSSLAAIAENDQRILNDQNAITQLQNIINDLQGQADILRIRSSSLETQVERVRSNLASAQVQADNIDAQIAQNTDAINKQKKYLVNGDLNALKSQIATLKSLERDVDQEVNRQYYFCFGKGAFSVAKTGDVVVYIIAGNAFPALLENTYGVSFADLTCCTDQSAGVSSNPKANLPSEIKLTTTDIFSEEFTKNNGHALIPVVVDKVVDGTSVKEIDSFSGDFSCVMNDASQESAGRGVIVACNGNQYTVRNYAHNTPTDNIVNVASCTIIMSTTKVPRVGMNMAYTGSNRNGVTHANMVTSW